MDHYEAAAHQAARKLGAKQFDDNYIFDAAEPIMRYDENEDWGIC